jgi:glucose-1-phosphate thymidylyltransferase
MKDGERRVVGLVPAAGKGSRLAPFPAPKELFPIGYQDYDTGKGVEKRPKVVSQYLIENMLRAGMDELFIIVGDSKQDILRYYGDGHRFDTRIVYLYQEQLTGMPGALNLAEPWIRDADVVFGMPDTIIEPPDAFQRLYRFQQDQNSDLTIGLFRTDNPGKFGMVEIDADHNVLSTVDKPKDSSLEYMWGFACWTPRFTALMAAYLRENPYRQREIVLGDVFNHALEAGMSVKALPFDDGQYMDIGTSAELNVALQKFHL